MAGNGPYMDEDASYGAMLSNLLNPPDQSGPPNGQARPLTPEEERAALLLPDDREPAIGDDVLCLGLLVPSEHTVKVNLNAPIVINLHNSMGVQCVSTGQGAGCVRLGENGRWEAAC